ncbi:MAG: TetR family transcriptional regulator [Aeromicrobium sp.]|uniref:TetR family transcriptional regulator n=1 Tax=Aeromicrobium sp. TaxID=1871063 RepID=UPI0039E6234E
MSDADQPVEPTRTERKEHTRRAILAAALKLTEDSSLGALSLRAVAREVGIAPNALYRHFASADHLGLALVEESFGALRTMLMEVRTAPLTNDGVIGASVSVLIERVKADRAQFAFISRERVGASPVVRAAIARELELFEAEVATDFARLPGAIHWSTDDLRISAGMIVATLVAAAERLIYSTPTPELEAEVARRTKRQFRMIAIGALNWRSSGRRSGDDRQ